MPAIEVQNIYKQFRVTKKQKGLRGAVKGLFAPQRSTVDAVDDISFRIEPGETVGYVGPNGAGKSTTIKILTGILHPTSGNVRVAGISPQKDRQAVVRNLGVVFGQRSQLHWDIRLGESFELLRRIYRVDDGTYNDNMSTLCDLLGIDSFIDTPVRQLSLGQRMRGDLAAAMLHSPQILFLDEPTIGLDIVAKQAVRDFILELNRKRETTVILTTHDLTDVEQVCRRLMVINHGRLIEDGPLDALVDKLAPYRIIEVDLAMAADPVTVSGGTVIKQDQHQMQIRFDRTQATAAEIIAQVSRQCSVRDLSVREPAIEDAIRKIYAADTADTE